MNLILKAYLKQFVSHSWLCFMKYWQEHTINIMIIVLLLFLIFIIAIRDTLFTIQMISRLGYDFVESITILSWKKSRTWFTVQWIILKKITIYIWGSFMYSEMYVSEGFQNLMFLNDVICKWLNSLKTVNFTVNTKINFK